jgi:hypothetical protein
VLSTSLLWAAWMAMWLLLFGGERKRWSRRCRRSSWILLSLPMSCGRGCGIFEELVER